MYALCLGCFLEDGVEVVCNGADEVDRRGLPVVVELHISPEEGAEALPDHRPHLRYVDLFTDKGRERGEEAIGL